MTGPWGQILAGVAAAGEVIVIVTAGVSLGLRYGLTFAESAAYGAIGTMMALSFLYQATFLTGLPSAGHLAETLLVTAAAFYLTRRAGRPSGAVSTLQNTARHSPLALAVLFLAVIWLGWNAMVFQPDMDQWASLWPVLDMEKHGGLTVSGPFLNHRILSHLTLRFHTRFGLGLFGLLSYGSIGAATYALARRYAWPETALTVAMIVMSAPRLVMQATTPGLELIPAAAVVFALLALYRTVEQPTAPDFLLLGLGITFAVSDNPMGVTAPIILVALSGVVLFRRHGGRRWWRLIADKPGLAMLAIAPLTVFSQVFQMAGGTAAKAHYAQNPDGIVGGGANLVRYFLESFHLTSAADSLCLRLIGVSPAAMIDRFYTVAVFPFCGARGAAAPFAVTWHKAAAGAWFGPLWFLLVLPAWLYAMVRGPRRLKAVAVSLAGYVYLTSLIPAWMPGNAGLFTVFFSSAGFMTAYLLPPWHFTARRRMVVQTICLTLMVYACAHMAFGAF
ncbi:MAG: hypothetical protein ABIL58_14730 [Pseudomonadota bacterium]